MALPKYVLPVGIGVGVLATVGIALRIRSMLKPATTTTGAIATAPSAKPAGLTPTALPPAAQPAVVQQVVAAGIPVTQLQAAGTTGLTPDLVQQAAAAGVSLDQLQAAASAGAAAAANIATAVVTTNDPPPSGDLAIRSTPDNSAPIIGGADKDGTVIILDPNADGNNVFAQVQWDGGRNAAASGFAHKSALRLV